MPATSDSLEFTQKFCQDHPKPKGAKNPVQHCHPPPEIVLAMLRIIPINLTVYPKPLCGHKDNPDPKRIHEDSTQIAHSTESLSWTSCPAFPLLVTLVCTSMPFALPLEKLDLLSSRVDSDRASITSLVAWSRKWPYHVSGNCNISHLFNYFSW